MLLLVSTVIAGPKNNVVPPLSGSLTPPVFEISYPSAESQRRGDALNGITETNTLNHTRIKNMRLNIFQ